ncbi:MAG: hypothetical protein H0Z18_08870 [Thermococcus sp.]|uniref:hypothetical protein n=1 Tax=Thermococcus sp. TaxID=35749 RepID=UPI001E181B8D|nr:hypothetical protein [Thermococcus sp.]MBO8175356.1 hypothetical protein [Thermococcus sp.]
MKREKTLFLIVLLGIVLVVSGCTQNGIPTETQKTQARESTIQQTTTQTSPTQTSSEVQIKKGVETVSIFNQTYAVNMSLIPPAYQKCLQKAPEVIRAYYEAVKNEQPVLDYFDLRIVDNESLVELHNALYQAVDFSKLEISDPECVMANTELVACKYHYSAEITKDGESKSIERNYITFLSSDECKIIWTEEEK